jgi:outer membrane protein, heavy metal efflux system
LKTPFAFRSLLTQVAWGAAMLLAAPAVVAQSTGTSLGRDLRGVLEFLEARNPELRSMSLDVDAARLRPGVAGALPDPMFQIELRDVPLRDPTLSPAVAGSTRYLVRQTFPLGDKRTLRRGVAEAEIGVADARRLATLTELRTRAKVAYAQYFYAAQVQQITRSVLELIGQLEQVARSRYGTGLVPQQDVIRAQTEVTAMRSELVMLASTERQAVARLNGLLARPATAPLAQPEGGRPIPPRALDLDYLSRAALERNPQLAVQSAQLSGAERSIDLVRANRWPDLSIGVATIQRGSRLMDYELMVEINIPWQRDVLRASETEAATMRSAVQARRDAAAAQLAGELGENWAALAAISEQAQILGSTLLPQSELTFESALSGYQNGRVDFGTLLDAERQIRNTRLDLLRLELEQQMRLAELERIVGEDL